MSNLTDDQTTFLKNIPEDIPKDILENIAENLTINEGEYKIDMENLGPLGKASIHYMLKYRHDDVYGSHLDVENRLKWGKKI